MVWWEQALTSMQQVAPHRRVVVGPRTLSRHAPHPPGTKGARDRCLTDIGASTPSGKRSSGCSRPSAYALPCSRRPLPTPRRRRLGDSRLGREVEQPPSHSSSEYLTPGEFENAHYAALNRELQPAYERHETSNHGRFTQPSEMGATPPKEQRCYRGCLPSPHQALTEQHRSSLMRIKPCPRPCQAKALPSGEIVTMSAGIELLIASLPSP